MNPKITKILAVGTNKRFMWLKINEITYCIRISDKMYEKLKELNIPTAQSLRKNLHAKNKQ